MPGYKPLIKIDKNDKDSYRILNGLKEKREFIFDNSDKVNRHLLNSIGRSSRSVVPKKPVVWHSPNRVKDGNIRLLKLPPEVEIEETHGNDKIFFKFKRRNIL